MKTIKRLLFSLAMGLLFTNVAVADDITPILKIEGNKLFVSLDGVAAPTTVQIVDPAGYTWIEESVADAGSYKKVIDLERLPLGSYTLIIKSNAEEIFQPITTSGTEWIVDESKRTAYFDATVRQQQEQINLSLLNPTNSVVRIFILDAKGRMIHQEAIEGQRVIDRKLDLEYLPKGNYTVVVDNAHESFTKTVKLH